MVQPVCCEPPISEHPGAVSVAGSPSAGSRPLNLHDNFRALRFDVYMLPRSPGTHIVGPWVIDSLNSYRDLRTGTQYIGNWASRVQG